MTDFNYDAPAELFAAQGRRPGVRYRRFLNAAEAIRYVIEKLPPNFLSAASLKVGGVRYQASELRQLYDSDGYPLKRDLPSANDPDQ